MTPWQSVRHAPFPSRRPPPRSCVHLAGTPSCLVDAYAYTSSTSTHAYEYGCGYGYVSIYASTALPWARGTGTYHMHFPRGAISHVLETPITDPQDAARVLSVDRTCKEVHRTSMSESILAFTVRERVRREVPTTGGRGDA